MNRLYRGYCDLHRHLDGSLRWDTVCALAIKTGQRVPDDLIFTPGMGLFSALERFAFTVSLLQEPDHLTRVAAEMVEDSIQEELDHLEVRFAPQLHGADSALAVDAVLEGLGPSAGLILCGLYGDSPDSIASLIQLARTRPGVVGIDLAGGPSSTHEWGLMDYASVFSRARSQGLGVTIHAGEGRPAEEIAWAVEHLGAQRIGHGVTLMEDPAVLELVLERDIVIEACPTSNVHTGVIRSVADHPIAQWLAAGVSVAICTDNSLLSDVDLPTELERVHRECALSQEQMNHLRDMSIRAVFPRA